jgi:hypothetical protein
MTIDRELAITFTFLLAAFLLWWLVQDGCSCAPFPP